MWRCSKNLDLEVPAGQFLTIVGKSGCGKSTLLRLLVGLDEPTGGRISFIDRDGNDVPASSRIVFQEPRRCPGRRGRQCGGRAQGRRQRGLPARQSLAALARCNSTGEGQGVAGAAVRRAAAARGAGAGRWSAARNSSPWTSHWGALDALTRITMQGLRRAGLAGTGVYGAVRHP